MDFNELRGWHPKEDAEPPAPMPVVSLPLNIILDGLCSALVDKMFTTVPAWARPAPTIDKTLRTLTNAVSSMEDLEKESPFLVVSLERKPEQTEAEAVQIALTTAMKDTPGAPWSIAGTGRSYIILQRNDVVVARLLRRKRKKK